MTQLVVDAEQESTLGALDRLASEFGPDAVTFREPVVAEFRDPYRAAGRVLHQPVGVVFPTSTEQVRTVLRVAAEYGVAVQTGSQGRS